MKLHPVLGIAFVIFAVVSLAQSPRPHLTIVVQDRSGAVISGAFVHVRHWSHEEKPESVVDGNAYTDGSGRATFPLAEGSYQIYVSARAFVSQAADVEVKRDRDMERRFNLDVQNLGGTRVEAPRME